MADPGAQDRLLPCFLERLSDDESSSQKESREQRVISLKRYRESVLRDLEVLLNTTRSMSREQMEEFGEVAGSVVNYGSPNLCGLSVSSISIEQVEREIASVITLFEPRIDKDSLSIKVNVKPEDMSSNAVSFSIEGELWAKPIPEQLYLRTELDLETGRVNIQGRSDG
jgi:type VI secretion system protein ImpF